MESCHARNGIYLSLSVARRDTRLSCVLVLFVLAVRQVFLVFVAHYFVLLLLLVLVCVPLFGLVLVLAVSLYMFVLFHFIQFSSSFFFPYFCSPFGFVLGLVLLLVLAVSLYSRLVPLYFVLVFFSLFFSLFFPLFGLVLDLCCLLSPFPPPRPLPRLLGSPRPLVHYSPCPRYSCPRSCSHISSCVLVLVLLTRLVLVLVPLTLVLALVLLTTVLLLFLFLLTITRMFKGRCTDSSKAYTFKFVCLFFILLVPEIPGGFVDSRQHGVSFWADMPPGACCSVCRASLPRPSLINISGSTTGRFYRTVVP